MLKHYIFWWLKDLEKKVYHILFLFYLFNEPYGILIFKKKKYDFDKKNEN